MGMNKKGSRLLEYEGETYRWKLAWHQYSGVKCLDMLVELAEEPGARLIRSFVPDEEGRFSLPITPGTAQQNIREALDAGWTPDVKGPQFRLPRVEAG